VRIKFINRKALDYQTAVEQPSFWHVIRITVGFVSILEIIRIILYLTSSLPTGTALQVFRIAWLASILTLWTLMAFAFKNTFPEALKFPPSLRPPKWTTQTIILVFAAIFLTGYAIKMGELYNYLMHLISTSKGHKEQFQQILVQIHTTLWKEEHFDTDILGVVLGSVSVLSAPVFEELFFRGYLLNCLCQRYHWFTAIFASAFWFALCHIFNKPIGQIPIIFMLGLCCGIIRLQSGRWQDALKLHFIYNYCIIAPKIGIAWLRFHIAP
jgi:membrane protease YdiL (CAAX protease family)